jgi:GntR family transcriptional regulator
MSTTQATPPSRADIAKLLRDGGTLDRASPIPLWRQLHDRLAASIRDEELPPDARLPSELDLCAVFEVSRPVVRAALEALTVDAMVVKATRRGAFVAHRKAELDFAASNIGLFGEMIAKGHKVTTRLIRLERRSPIARESAMLRLPPGVDVVHLERLYLVDGQPISVGTIALPASRVPGLQDIDFVDRSLYATLRDRYGLVVAKSERWLEAVVPSEPQRALLGLDEHVPVIAIESLGCLADGSPIEYYNALYSTRDRRLHLMVGATGIGAPGDDAP